LTLNNLSAADAATYCVVVSGACNSVTNCAVLAVNTPTTATALISLTNCPGATVTFSTVASGTGPFTYQWFKGGSELEGQTSSTLTLNDLSATDAATYCVVVGGVCNSVTNCAILAVNEPTMATALVSLTNCPGTTATFITTASGTGPFTFVWRKDGNELAGQTNSSLQIPSVTQADAGTYTVEVRGECGTASSSATLTVDDSACLRITAITLSDDVRISFTTTSDGFYRVERTDDLTQKSWETMADQVPGTGGVVQVTDVGGAGKPGRLYRVVRLPN
jgi:hypothetical protein